MIKRVLENSVQPRRLSRIVGLSLILLLLLVANIPCQTFAAPSFPLRVNAGGNTYTDSLGNFWNADQAYGSGNWGFYGPDNTADRGTGHAISGTVDDRIYQTERWGLSGYRFDLGDGTYTVILHFAETHATGPDQRAFDVSIEGQLVLDDLDIFSEVSHSTALAKAFRNIGVNDGQLEIEFASSIEDPEINGIEIFASGQNTPPELTPIGNNKSVVEGQSLTFTIAATDYEGDPLNYFANNLPPGASFDTDTHTFSWTPIVGQAGTYPNVHFEVSDGELNDSEDITITVRALLFPALRVNAGGNAYTDSLGNFWNADQAYGSGNWGFYGPDNTVDRGTGHAISGTVDDRIYQTERWGLSGYRFDLGDGTYTVILHFAETHTTGPDQRAFDVSIEGQLVLDDLDIFSEVSHSTALTKVFRDIDVNNGQLEIEFASSIENPEINGIEISAAGQIPPLPGGMNNPPVADAGGTYNVDEGSPVTLDGSGSSDSDGSIVSYEWDLDNDGQYDDATGVTAIRTYDDNGAYIVGLKVTDDFGESDTDEADVLVNNVAPTVGPITATTDPVEVSTPINASADFTDPGTADTHTAVWDWGDGTTPGTVTQGADSGSVANSHTYSAAGIYTISLTVTDDDGGSGQSIFQYVVVYDPSAGFVTGGGWIYSDPGAYRPDPNLEGKANFGFVSKYKKGRSTPTGNTEFQFHAGDLNFHSDNYDWLVVTGSDYAMFKGLGTINGMGEYKFRIWAGDNNPDTFRIKLWEEDGAGVETVVYDNDSDQAIASGSIVIHQK